jgi:glycosyltransferase involved in cell wall biosynthesis
VKSVLIVAYHFPPLGGMGSLRVARFAKYLPPNGWLSTILTVRDDPTRPHDLSLLGKLPDNLCVVRTPAFRRPSTVIVPPWSASSRKPRTSNSPTVDRQTKRCPRVVARSMSAMVRARVRDAILFPDPQIGWVPFALAHGLKLLCSERPDVLLVTGPPWSALVVGAALSRVTGVPLVSDFRDPLADYAFRDTWCRAQRALAAQLESYVCSTSQAILVVSPQMRHGLIARHGDRVAGKVAIVANSFDPADFPNQGGPLQTNCRFTIAYVGSFYRSISPATFLQGVADFIGKQGLSPADIVVRVAGQTGPELATEVQQAGMENFVDVLGYVQHSTAVRVMRGADVLALIVPDVRRSEAIVTGKVFEYLASGNPILALAPTGAARDLALRSGRAVCADPEDAAAVCRALCEMYQSWERGGPVTQGKERLDLEQYSSLATTRQLARVLNAVA